MKVLSLIMSFLLIVSAFVYGCAGGRMTNRESLSLHGNIDKDELYFKAAKKIIISGAILIIGWIVWSIITAVMHAVYDDLTEDCDWKHFIK